MAYKRPRASSPPGSHKRQRAPTQLVKWGTPLSVEDDEGTFQPVWKQSAPRLHGAFTGGFSAGQVPHDPDHDDRSTDLKSYFNTVGSKEGWTPKAFVSSRSNRKNAAQRAEDFMDEEDLADAADSRKLEATQSSSAIGSTAAGLSDDLFGLFISEAETMGVKLLQKMGWRRGQGVGPKVRRAARFDDTYSASRPQEDSSEHWFAPEDVPLVCFARDKVHRKGLGYQSGAVAPRKLNEQDEEKEPDERFALPSFAQSKKSQMTAKPTSKKPAFGVGILNDDGSDDDDPYELGPKLSFNRTIGKDKKKKQTVAKPSKFGISATGERHVFVSKRDATRKNALARLEHARRTALAGFMSSIGVTSLPDQRKYPPPDIPSGWKPSKTANDGVTVREFKSVTEAAKSSTLNAKARSSLLGEAPLPSRSVFDFISKEDRDHLAKVTGKADLPQGLGHRFDKQSGEGDTKQQPWSFVPALDKPTAAAALEKGASGWMPYAEDEKKRARYIGFLELRAGVSHTLPERAPTTSVADWAKELEEFAQAAKVFKPVQGHMASRFVSSSAPQANTGGAEAGNHLLSAASSKPEDPAEIAARMGSYGPMTRSVIPFHPNPILLKRFGVKPPPNVPHG